MYVPIVYGFLPEINVFVFVFVKDICSHNDLLCSISRSYNLCSAISMIILYDHCLLVPLWFRFHNKLATCLMFGFRSSYFISKCARKKTPLLHDAIEVVHPTQV